MSQLNNNNFFRWYSGDVVDEQSMNLPRLGLVDQNRVYLPQIVCEEETGFFINSDIPFYDDDQLADLELRLSDGTVIGAILQSVNLSPGYRLYGDFTFPTVPQGQYQYVIYNTNTLTTKCISNFFQVIDGATADLYTCTVQWRNSRDAYYYNWSIIPDFYCRLRLNLSLSNYAAEGTVDQTKAVSTGTRRNNNYDIDLSVKLQTYYFDDGANLACIPLFVASSLIINGTNYINKTLYTPNARVSSGVSIGEIELYNQPYSRVNKYGQLPQLVLKTGKYLIINDSSVDFTINYFSATNVALGNQVVPAGSTYVVQVADLQINSYLNISANSAAAVSCITAFSMPDGTFQFIDNAITDTDPTNEVTQNQIYGNDWVVLLTECANSNTTTTTTTTTSSTSSTSSTSTTTSTTTTTTTTTRAPGNFEVASQYGLTITGIFNGSSTGVPSALNSISVGPDQSTAAEYTAITGPGTIQIQVTGSPADVGHTYLELVVNGVQQNTTIVPGAGTYFLAFTAGVADPIEIQVNVITM